MPIKNSSTHIIEIKSLKTVIGEKIIHEDINLEVSRGETMIVVGASGSGKSVLFKSIVGLMQPTEGSIIIEGVDITSVSLKEMTKIRNNFGVLFQGGALFDSLNVYENLAFPLYNSKLSKQEKDKIIDRKLELVGLKPNIKYHMTSELSMGVQKRVALARAIVMNPRIILYDEPTTGLDPLIAGIIDELIIHLQKELKVTSLVVTHDLKSAFKVGDRLSFLHKGVIAVCEPVEEIKNTNNPYLKEFIRIGTENS